MADSDSERDTKPDLSSPSSSSSVGSNSSSSSPSTRTGQNGSALAASITPLQDFPAPLVPLTPDQVHRQAMIAESTKYKTNKVPWTPEEDEVLRKAVEQYKGRAWKQVAELLPGRTHSQAAHRWQKVLDPKLRKGAWTEDEDNQLQRAVDEMGEGHWSRVAERVGSRNGKQCRERWRNQISPEVNKRPWLRDEDEGITRLYTELGPKWAEIAKHFPGRTENAVKNRWNAKLGRSKANGGGGSTASSPTTPNVSRRHRDDSTPRSSSQNGTTGTRKGGRKTKEPSSAASAAASANFSSPMTPGYRSSNGRSVFSLSTPASNISMAILASHALQSPHIDSLSASSLRSNNVGLRGLDASLMAAAASSVSGLTNGNLPPMPPKKRQKTSPISAEAMTTSDNIDATQALLALKAGPSPAKIKL